MMELWTQWSRDINDNLEHVTIAYFVLAIQPNQLEP